jgi:hypothetical protein
MVQEMPVQTHSVRGSQQGWPASHVHTQKKPSQVGTIDEDVARWGACTHPNLLDRGGKVRDEVAIVEFVYGVHNAPRKAGAVGALEAGTARAAARIAGACTKKAVV